MLLAAIYIPLAINNFEVIENSLWFSLLPVVVSASYLILAKNTGSKFRLLAFLSL
ncbi:hypothetical protein PFLA_b0854 [Pseudoalteromonas flavipulchra NCIMB 2033 = ATCC BAA-314]|nr:hypothetical protein [Pseudoalteromonas flavipulchra NCIMB 2033 = ATCC BAA-314]